MIPQLSPSPCPSIWHTRVQLVLRDTSPAPELSSSGWVHSSTAEHTAHTAQHSTQAQLLSSSAVTAGASSPSTKDFSALVMLLGRRLLRRPPRQQQQLESAAQLAVVGGGGGQVQFSGNLVGGGHQVPLRSLAAAAAGRSFPSSLRGLPLTKVHLKSLSSSCLASHPSSSSSNNQVPSWSPLKAGVVWNLKLCLIGFFRCPVGVQIVSFLPVVSQPVGLMEGSRYWCKMSKDIFLCQWNYCFSKMIAHRTDPRPSYPPFFFLPDHVCVDDATKYSGKGNTFVGWPGQALELQSSQVELLIGILKLWAFEEAMGKDIWNQVPDRTALAVKRNGKWVKWTFAEYEEQVKKIISLLFRFIAQCIYISQVRSLAKAFIHLGLKKSHSVCIIGFNAPEWHISCLATVVAGGLTTGVLSIGSKMYLFQLCWIKSESDVNKGQEKCKRWYQTDQLVSSTQIQGKQSFKKQNMIHN